MALAAPSTEKPETILLGLSGPSCSGKTTLARLLKEIFNLTLSSEDGWKISLFILHQDDFYKTDKDVPIVTVSSPEHGTRDLQDWDCVESIDLPLFEHTLTHVRDHGTLPPDSLSKEDQNETGESGVSEDEVQSFKHDVQRWFEALVGDKHQQSSSRTNDKAKGKGREIRICIQEGFLLFPPPPPPPPPSSLSQTSNTNTPSLASSSSSSEIRHLYTLTHALLHPRLFLPSTRAQTVSRRLARAGYVTLEGFWTDPPGYVEDVVWPNYARDHAWMYAGGDVDAGHFDPESCDREEVHVCPGEGHWVMRQCLAWAVDRVKDAVARRV